MEKKIIIELNDLQQVIQYPTRITAHSETIINYLYVACPDKLLNLSVPTIAICEHFIISVLPGPQPKALSKDNNIEQFNIAVTKIINEDAFSNQFSISLISLVISEIDSYLNLNEILTKVLNNHAP